MLNGSNFKTGEIAGATSATQMPDVAGEYIRIKAASNNAGIAYVGGSGVTKADGTTDVTTGWPLAAGEEMLLTPGDNLNRYYYICDNAGDDLIYWVQQ